MPVPQGSGVINRKSARQAVYEEVCDWIITGVLEPGEKILDSELGEYFHVSRTPVREALQQLQSQKLVLVMPGRATVVAPLDPMDIEQCYKPLAELQALAAELACGKLTQEDFFELECALRDAKAAGEKDDAAAVMACDERFHEMIVQAAGNAYVTEFSGTLMLHIRRIKYHYFHLPAMRLILREPGSGTRNILERELFQQGYGIEAFQSCVCISSFKIIRELVASGCGVSFLYEAVVKADAQFGHFFCPPLTGVHELNVVFLQNTGAGAYARRFLHLEA